jgi:hypothetical protein
MNAMLAKNLSTKAMERPDIGAFFQARDEGGYALLHFIGGFVRKSYRENVPYRDSVFRDEISDTMRNDACFAGTCAREN